MVWGDYDVAFDERADASEQVKIITAQQYLLCLLMCERIAKQAGSTHAFETPTLQWNWFFHKAYLIFSEMAVSSKRNGPVCLAELDLFLPARATLPGGQQ